MLRSPTGWQRLDETHHLKRRQFITLLGGAVAWPLGARAQQSAVPVIGFLSSHLLSESGYIVAAYRQGLDETGYIEGKNVAIEYRWAEGFYDRLPALTADLVQRQVTVIVTGSTPATLAAKAATTSIPIVFYVAVDPVEVGLVAGLNQPGGNLTGVTNLSVELGPKQLELLHELVPTTSTIALLVNPTNRALAKNLLNSVQAAAHTLGLQLHILNASNDDDIDSAFTTLVQLRAGGLGIGVDNLFTSRSSRLAILTARHTVPAIHPRREFAAAGG